MGNYLVALTEAWKFGIEHRWNGVEEKKKMKNFFYLVALMEA